MNQETSNPVNTMNSLSDSNSNSSSKSALQLGDHDAIASFREQHTPRRLAIFYHKPSFAPYYEPQHFATIRLKDLCADQASIEVTSDGKAIYFRNGIYRSNVDQHREFVTELLLPPISAKLYDLGEPDEDAEWEYPDFLSAFSGDGSSIFFGQHGEGYGGSEALQLLRHWNQFEDLGLSWMERNWMLCGCPVGEEHLDDFKAECAKLGLEPGKKIDYEEPLLLLDECLSLLEYRFWQQIHDLALTGLQNAKNRRWSRNDSIMAEIRAR
jgi:hypothetical protein